MRHKKLDHQQNWQTDRQTNKQTDVAERINMQNFTTPT